MEIMKERKRTNQHELLKYLERRVNLNSEDRRKLSNFEKGYNGEEKFDEKVKQYLSNELILINDLSFEFNGSLIQIDSLIIAFDTITIYEIKNYAGDYLLESAGFQTVKGTEISNPLIQLARTKQKLSSMLKFLGFEYHRVDAYIVFINESFHLYNSRIEDPIIYPTQLKEYLRKINLKSKQLTRADFALAEKLCELHEVNFTNKDIPKYSYEKIKEGLVCSNCGSFDYKNEGRYYKCNQCHKKKASSEVVLKQIEELRLLFPNQLLTVGLLKRWCKGAVSSYKIREVMKANFKVHQDGKRTYYS